MAAARPSAERLMQERQLSLAGMFAGSDGHDWGCGTNAPGGGNGLDLYCLSVSVLQNLAPVGAQVGL
jgi:hypothetical protein